ncbi:MAG: sigma-70 family RNA polymerase sigma factor [Pirellulales bacterium]|nr:sigma-70 family RNA polymerase sigma factor [Pirellulales bacterium]
MPRSAGQTTEIEHCLDRLRAGDAAARDALFAFATERLHRLAHRLLKDFPRVRRWEETDDVVQQAAIRLQRALSAGTPSSPSHFFRLAAVQIRRELIDLARRLYGSEGMGAHHDTVGRRPGETDSVPFGDQPPAATDGPATVAEWTEFHETVERLPEEERELFDLYFYAGLPLKEAAESLNISERTAKRRWRSARLMLHKALHGARPGDH